MAPNPVGGGFGRRFAGGEATRAKRPLFGSGESPTDEHGFREAIIRIPYNAKKKARRTLRVFVNS